MIFRRNILPKRGIESVLLCFVLMMIPATFWFEVFVVLPRIFTQWGLWYNVHFTLGIFILFNISSNWLLLLICDTSIKGRDLPQESNTELNFCNECKVVQPLRCWHCFVCNVCILRRDHHCIFIGYCIGHYNWRYFLMFMMFTGIATTYMTPINFYYGFMFADLANVENIVKLICPLTAFYFGFSLNYATLIFIFLVMLVSLSMGFLTLFHLMLMMKGVVTHERNEKPKIVLNMKILKKNIEEVLGRNWYFTCVVPFLKSELPYDAPLVGNLDDFFNAYFP